MTGGVPEEITRGTACALLRNLGLDPDVVASMEMTPKSISVAIYSLDEQGQRFLTPPASDGTQKPATRTVTIRIV